MQLSPGVSFVIPVADQKYRGLWERNDETEGALWRNLVPRSLVDEAEGEIWQSKKICFSWLAAPFDSCPISSLKIDAVFRGKLSSNSSSNLEISAVGENEKIWK